MNVPLLALPLQLACLHVAPSVVRPPQPDVAGHGGRPSPWHRRLGLFLALLFSFPAWAQTWRLETLNSRTGLEGQPVRLTVATHVAAQQPRHVVIAPLTAQNPVITSGATTLGANGPWVRSAATLAQSGVALVVVDAPSDAAGRGLSQRPGNDIKRDLQAVVEWVAARHPGVPIRVGLLGASGETLDATMRLRGVTGIASVGSMFLRDRIRAFPSTEQPMLFVHASTAQCDAAPLLEAEAIAHRLGSPLVRVGYEQLEARAGCDSDSQHALRGAEPEFARLIVRWLDGGMLPAAIGHLPARAAWNEQLLHYEVPGLLGRTKLEMTLLLPEGPGPHPVVVFNHGDPDADSPFFRHRQRMRNMVTAREFLQLGLAVAMPARRGVGLSEGTYPRGFSTNDGDAVHKARVHAEDFLPALDALRELSVIDANRIVLAGQSAGGYSASYAAGLPLPGVVGVINFSGGRTDLGTSGVGHLNQMMVSGFAAFGRAAKVPALLIFAEEDQRYSTTTIRAAHDAYISAGGRATLVLAPPLGRDGHLVYLAPEHWRAPLQNFLTATGVLGGGEVMTRSLGAVHPQGALANGSNRVQSKAHTAALPCGSARCTTRHCPRPASRPPDCSR